MSTRIDLVRHGQPVGANRFLGTTDAKLSHEGWRQMEQTLASHPAPWQKIFTSPKVRCFEFAQGFSQRHHLPLYTEPRFEEFHFGRWDGLTPYQIMLRNPIKFSRFVKAPLANMPHESEDFDSFEQRVLNAWQQILQIYRNQHLLVITHGGVIMIVLKSILGISPSNVLNLRPSYAGLTQTSINQKNNSIKYQLLGFNLR